MAVDVVVHLDRLRCVREADAGGESEPYAWTALIAGTQDSFRTGEIELVAPSASDGARAVIKRGMRDGDQATMPAVQRTLVHRFGDDAGIGFVAVVVVLLEDDGLPGNGIRAGYRKFLEVLKDELSAFLRAGGGVPDMHDVDELRRAIEPKVARAVKGALSFGQKLWIQLGFQGKDDILGFDAEFTLIIGPTTSFTLSFEHKVTIPAQTLNPSGAPPIVITPEREVVSDIYRIEGRFERRVPSPGTPTRPPATRPPRVPPRPPGTQEP